MNPRHALLLSTLLCYGLAVSSQAHAFDLGNALKDAVKQQTGGEATTGSEVQTPAGSASTQTSFNWKSPSPEEEMALGRQLAGNLLGAAPLVKDAKLQAYVNQVGRWVASQTDRQQLAWHFGVIDSDDLNAFATPGGYILITKGLYRKLDNEAQLAGVLGHEVAHVVKKHHLKVLQKSQLLNLGASVIGDKVGKGDQTLDKVIGSGAEMMARGLDKDAEYEADRVGVALSVRAGYDGYGLPEVLQTLGQVNQSDDSVTLLFKTHPSPEDRLTRLGDAIGSRLDGVNEGKLLADRFYRLPK
ncbi:M48 family metallopeptidase [Methylobacillus flagellatus]|uniref:M48 family metallopeptidase n=1 Tax=Methylobacillus flagellatus TaxID=405 RepID=UPI0010F5CE7F|nr:M48 family metallopeptidase [Methylobacillus flagellatus]